MIFDMKTRNERKHKSDPKRFSLWSDQFYLDLVDL